MAETLESGICAEIRARLLELADPKYRVFHAKLIPGVEFDSIIGVRVPDVRRLAKEYASREDIGDFLDRLPHGCYDENNLHGLIIGLERDFEHCIELTDKFLPYVDNWATCDIISPRIFKTHRAELLPHVRRWLASGEAYSVRFGIEMLMSHYLDGDFSPEYLEWVASVRSEEYYVRMAAAWYFATALAKQYDAAVKYIEERRTDSWVHNKSIQKACESYRVPEERKKYLRSLKIR